MTDEETPDTGTGPDMDPEAQRELDGLAGEEAGAGEAGETGPQQSTSKWPYDQRLAQKIQTGAEFVGQHFEARFSAIHPQLGQIWHLSRDEAEEWGIASAQVVYHLGGKEIENPYVRLGLLAAGVGVRVFMTQRMLAQARQAYADGKAGAEAHTRSSESRAEDEAAKQAGGDS